MIGVGNTNVGKIRKINQDYVYINNDPIGSLDNLYIVADGVGGHKAGEIASESAIDFFEQFIYETEDVKAAYLFVMFKSGENSTVNDVQHIDGSYDANPWSLDTFVGSVLKVDNVKLNYEYEYE